MTQAELGGPILAAVSRSFYLTIRLLPPRLRAPIGLAYLLARTSDTIADSASASAALRLAHLAAFESMLGGASRETLAALQRDIAPGCSESEQRLLAQIGPCLDWLAHLDPFDRAEIQAVMHQIVCGQRLDLERFTEAGPDRVISLSDPSELEEYTYLVAGCVGEFWTRLCLHWLPRYSSMPSPDLCAIGIDFGKGLQLVNILRDLPADLRQGRCYLPALRESAGAVPSHAASVFAFWLARARELLAAGARYVAAIRPARVRMGCFLPWSLGVQTLDLLEQFPPLETSRRVKVPRATVYRSMLTAGLAAFSDAPLKTKAAPSPVNPGSAPLEKASCATGA